jgi:hypothetical protein
VSENLFKLAGCAPVVVLSLSLLLASGAWGQAVPPAPPPPTPNADAAHKYIIRYDAKCMAEQIRVCTGGWAAMKMSPTTGPGPFFFRGSECSGSFRDRREAESSANACIPRSDTEDLRACERKEYTTDGWKDALRAEFAVIAEGLKRSCLAAGKTEEECSRSPAVRLPTPPVAASAPSSLPR